MFVSQTTQDCGYSEQGAEHKQRNVASRRPRENRRWETEEDVTGGLTGTQSPSLTILAGRHWFYVVWIPSGAAEEASDSSPSLSPAHCCSHGQIQRSLAVVKVPVSVSGPSSFLASVRSAWVRGLGNFRTGSSPIGCDVWTV